MRALDRPAAYEARLEPDHEVERALLLLFRGDALLVAEDGGAPPEGLPGDHAVDLVNYLGTLAGRDVFAARLLGDPPEGYVLRRLRGLHGRLPDDEFAVAGLAYQIVEWDRTHRFCGVDGTPTVPHGAERAKRCPECGLTSYPRLAPAVMVLVSRGEGADREVLLSRSPHFPPGMFSANAGFVEPSESLEACGIREVREEVGVEIRDLRYFDSQPWPFPHSLMIAFTAEYAGGEIVPQEGEIEEARWFRVDGLPALPTSLSIARRLIDFVVAGGR